MIRTFLLGLLLAACTAVTVAQTQDAHYWVFFTDKPSATTLAKSASPTSLGLTESAVERRLLARPGTRAVDEGDLPVHAPYIAALTRHGASIRVASRWLNAASAAIPAGALDAIRALPFVARVQRVGTWTGNRSRLAPAAQLLPRHPATMHDLDYGVSLDQLELVNVPKVHDVWIDGTGAVSGMLDNGFRWRLHEALTPIDVRGEYDFIFRDSVTSNEDADIYSQDEHGTITLSTFAGFKQGRLIGPAFRSAFWLAKTEDNRSETHAEEDFWIQGLEWLESKGVSVVNSSLGYIDFDDSTSYDWAAGQLDGRTAPTCLAALRAARLGVLVVNSMGNEGDHTGSLISPADADSIISAGAVDYSGLLAGFSSNGPTSDSRIKPDVVAPGVRVHCAAKTGIDAYQTASGTSLSAPLISGVATLVRSARPEMTVIQLRDALRTTASRAASPDTRYGWGLVDAWDALLANGLVMSTNPRVFWNGSTAVVGCWVLSHSAVQQSSVVMTYSVDGGPDRQLAMEFMTRHPDLDGFSGLYYARLPELPANAVVRYFITAADARETRTTPATAPATRRSFVVGTTNVIGSEQILPTEYRLSEAWPNPFISSRHTTVNFEYSLPDPARVHVELYDVYGRRLGTLTDADQVRGSHRLTHDASALATGVYFFRFAAGSHTGVRRVVVGR